MGRGGARGLPPSVAIIDRHAAIDEHAVAAGGELEGKAAGVGLVAHQEGRRRAGVGDDEAGSRVEPLVARVARVRYRRAARVVIGEHGGEQIGRRRAHAVELREGAVAVTEEAQHRHHAVDGVLQRRRRRHVARLESLPQRQEIEQDLDQDARVAADMAAIGQDLPVELVGEPLGRRAQKPRLIGKAEAGEGERHRRKQPRVAVAGLAHRAAQVAHLARQALQESAIESVIGVLQDQAAPG